MNFEKLPLDVRISLSPLEFLISIWSGPTILSCYFAVDELKGFMFVAIIEFFGDTTTSKLVYSIHFIANNYLPTASGGQFEGREQKQLKNQSDWM